MKNRHVRDSHSTLSIGDHVLNYILQKNYGTMGVSPRIKRKCASLLHGLMRTCLGVGLGIGFQTLLVMLSTLVSKPLSAFITTRRVAECSRCSAQLAQGKSVLMQFFRGLTEVRLRTPSEQWNFCFLACVKNWVLGCAASALQTALSVQIR